MHWIVELARYYLHHYGYWAVGIALLGENAGIPLPGETILLMASFAAFHSHLKLPWVILVAFCACVIGDNIGYWIGHHGGRPLLERYKKLFHISDATIRKGEEFLERRGSVAIFLARFIAGMRIVAGPLAGVLRMDWNRFLVANAAGAFVWVMVISCVGYFFGSQHRMLARYMKESELVILVVVVLVALYFWRKSRRKARKRQAEHEVAEKR